MDYTTERHRTQPSYLYTMEIKCISNIATLWSDFNAIWAMKTTDLTVNFNGIRGFPLKFIQFWKVDIEIGVMGPQIWIFTKRPRIRAFHIHPGRSSKFEQKILSLKKVMIICANIFFSLKKKYDWVITWDRPLRN